MSTVYPIYIDQNYLSTNSLKTPSSKFSSLFHITTTKEHFLNENRTWQKQYIKLSSSGLRCLSEWILASKHSHIEVEIFWWCPCLSHSTNICVQTRSIPNRPLCSLEIERQDEIEVEIPNTWRWWTLSTVCSTSQNV